MIAALICDTMYCIKQVFASKTFFSITVGILGARMLICFALFLSYMCNRVFSKNIDLDKEGIDTKGLSVHQIDMLKSDHRKRGCVLYTALPMSIFTGHYRISNRKHFAKQVVLGLLLDYLYLLAMVNVTGLNNSAVLQEMISAEQIWAYSHFETISMTVKLVNMLIIWPLEFFMFMVELYMKKNLERAGLRANTINEASRRKDYGTKYQTISHTTLLIIIVATAILTFFIEKQQCAEL